MLIGGSPQAWAWGDFDFTGTDAGGGNYRCHGKSEYLLPAEYPEYAYFETKDKFNIDNDKFYWRFDVKVSYLYENTKKLGDGTAWAPSKNLFEGEIYLVTSDGTKHLVETWKKDYGQVYNTPFHITNS